MLPKQEGAWLRQIVTTQQWGGLQDGEREAPAASSECCPVDHSHLGHHHIRGKIGDKPGGGGGIPPQCIGPCCGMQMLNANPHAAKHKAAKQQSQSKTLFSDIARGAFRLDTPPPPL